MNITYIAFVRMPTEKAHGYQIVKTIESFIRAGEKVELFVPKRRNPISLDPFSYYGISEKFNIKKIFCFDLVSFLPPLGFFLSRLSFAMSLIIFFLGKNKPDIFYGRDELTLFFLKLFFPRVPVYYELHDYPESLLFFWQAFFKKIDGLIVTNQWKINHLEKDWKIPKQKMLLARNAIDPKEFEIPETKEELIRKFFLPGNAILLGYIGQLKTKGWEKGVTTILKALGLLPESIREKIFFVCIGGSSADIGFYKEMARLLGVGEKAIFVGQVPRNKIPFYLKIFDILLMPFPRTRHYSFYMSPVKMFEYLAAGKPIIATDLPAIREVLNENNAYLIKSDEPAELAHAISEFVSDEKKRDLLGRRAKEVSLKYSLAARASRILQFIEETKL